MYFRFDYIEPPETIFKLEHGHYLILENNTLENKVYQIKDINHK